jgi:ribosomal protein L22
MQRKQPKNTDKHYWTAHAAGKMQYYGLSEQKVLGVIRRPKRIETGVAENTVAVMQPIGNMKYEKGKEIWKQELWVMYQLRGSEAIFNSQFSISKHNEKIIKKIKNINKEGAKKLENLKPKKLIIISAWRFPGISSEKDPIPMEVWREIEEAGIVI